MSACSPPDSTMGMRFRPQTACRNKRTPLNSTTFAPRGWPAIAWHLEFLRSPERSGGLYELSAGGLDLQGPRAEDEVYYVGSGRATITAGDEERPAIDGSVVFGGAHFTHKAVHIYERVQEYVRDTGLDRGWEQSLGSSVTTFVANHPQRPFRRRFGREGLLCALPLFVSFGCPFYFLRHFPPRLRPTRSRITMIVA